MRILVRAWSYADQALSVDRLPGHVHRSDRVLLPFLQEEGEQDAGACVTGEGPRARAVGKHQA